MTGSKNTSSNPSLDTEGLLAEARSVLAELGVTETGEPSPRPLNQRSTSILLPCQGTEGQPFLLKYFIPPLEGRFYPPEVNLEDYARREVAFYSFLDSFDARRRKLPAPKTIMMDPADPPRWVLLEHIHTAKGPRSEILSSTDIYQILDQFQDLPMDRLMGRRNFPLNRWDIASLRDRVVRLMYDPLIFILGEDTWAEVRNFFNEAMRWLETRKTVPVHGDFVEENIIVDEEGRPYLIDFERIGIGAPEHDFAWFWIHNDRPRDWKKNFFQRYLEDHFGSDRVRCEWSIRASVVYLACRRLRFGFLTEGETDPLRVSNLALLKAALSGGSDLFPQ